MPQPRPIDPLDDLIARFVTATNEFLAMKANVDPPEQITRTQNPIEDIMRGWEELKRHLQRCRVAMLGAEPEVAQRLENMIKVGNEIKSLTDDHHITNPVDGVVMRAIDERAVIGNVIQRLGNATSFPTVMSTFVDLAGFGKDSAARRKEIAKLLDDLQAYYLLRPEPPASA